LSFVRSSLENPERLGLWAGDLLYYRACDTFNGRRPPDCRRLRRFAPDGRPRPAFPCPSGKDRSLNAD
jgi:hypothetical protein